MLKNHDLVVHWWILFCRLLWKIIAALATLFIVPLCINVASTWLTSPKGIFPSDTPAGFFITAVMHWWLLSSVISVCLVLLAAFIWAMSRWSIPTSTISDIIKVEKMMPELFKDMRQDLIDHPLKREFVLLKKSWSYNSTDKIYLAYYYDDQEDLDSKITILCNHHLIRDITSSNVKRYNITENLVSYLTHK